MAEESTPANPDETDADDETTRESSDATPPASNEQDVDPGPDADDDVDASAEASREGSDPDPLPDEPQPGRRRIVLSARNLTTLGQVILHYEARDVTLFMDGDAALRLIELYRRRNDFEVAAVVQERFDPQASDAASGWVSLDLEDERLVAISWLPLPLSRRPRTVIDPLPV